MSQEAVLEFFDVLAKDEALKQRFTAISNPAEVVKIAESEMDYRFTEEELKEAIEIGKRNLQASPDEGADELTDEQLEAVAGGRAWWQPKNWRRMDENDRKNVAAVAAGVGAVTAAVAVGW